MTFPTLLLIRNAVVFAPQPLGARDLLVGGGRALFVDDVAMSGYITSYENRRRP